MSMKRNVRSGPRPARTAWTAAFAVLMVLLLPMTAFASELDLKLPTLD